MQKLLILLSLTMLIACSQDVQTTFETREHIIAAKTVEITGPRIYYHLECKDGADFKVTLFKFNLMEPNDIIISKTPRGHKVSERNSELTFKHIEL